MNTPDEAALEKMAETTMAALSCYRNFTYRTILYESDYKEILTALRQVRDAAAKDTKRLDWLEEQSNGTGWIARVSSTGRGYRLHNTNGGSSYQTAREAIDAAMSAGKGDGK